MEELMTNIIELASIAIITILTITIILHYLYYSTKKMEDVIEDSILIESIDENKFIGIKVLIVRLYELMLKNERWILKLYSKFRVNGFKYFIVIVSLLGFIRIIDGYNIDINEILMKVRGIDYNYLKLIGRILIFLILFKLIKGSYYNKLRKNFKEAYYKDVIKQYLIVKDIVLENIEINIENEKVIFRIYKYNKEILKDINWEIFNVDLSHKIYQEKYNEKFSEMLSYLEINMPGIDSLKKYEYDLGVLMTLESLYKKESRDYIMRSINKDLDNDIWFFSRECKGLVEIEKKKIIDNIIRNEKNMNECIREILIESIKRRYKLVFLINKIDKELGLNKKEGNMKEIVRFIRM